MKKFNILLFITVIILLLLSGWSIFHQPGYSSEDQFVTPTNIHFEKDTLSLGSVKYGTEQKAVFRFTNTGTAPLLIYNVVPSCDCTAVKWKKRPIKPGESGEIQNLCRNGKTCQKTACQTGKQQKVCHIKSGI